MLLPYFAPAPSRIRPSQAAGFTLLELLTVLAVVATLAAILIPVVSKARVSARNTRCVSNLRDIGSAMILYAHDNDDRLPASGAPDAPLAETWIAELHPYTGSPLPEGTDEHMLARLNPVFRCPDWPPADATEAEQTTTGYGMRSASNGSVAEWDRAQCLSTMAQPSRFVLVMEYPQHAFHPVLAARRTARSAVPLQPEAARHGAESNYLFADGHVDGRTPAEASELLASNP